MHTDPFHAVIDIATEASSQGELRTRALPSLAKATGARSAMWATWGSCSPRDLTGLYRMAPEVPEKILSGWTKYAHEMGALVEAIFAHKLVVDAQVLGEGMAELAFTREIKRPMGVSETMYCLLEHVPGRPSLIVMNRGLTDRKFGPRTIETMRALKNLLGLAEAAVSLKERSRVSGDWSALRKSERSVVELVRLGHTNRQIASALGISANTTRNRLARVFARLGVGSRAELIASLGTPPHQ